jgi:protein-tyrosine phosphatase
VIDLHAHVLPGVDDGPPDLEAAIALVAAMAGGGVEAVAATSHVSEAYRNRPQGLAAARSALQAELDAAGVPVRVLQGAEVTIEEALALDDATLEQLHLGGGPYLLVESPLSPAAVEVEDGIQRIMDRGHGVVLAHPERAPCFQRDHDQLVRLVVAGVLTSVTAGAFGGGFGRTAQATARRMLADDLVHDIASDAHDLARRPPGLAVEGIATTWFTKEAPAAILAGEPPGMAPVRIELGGGERRSGWRRLLRR